MNKAVFLDRDGVINVERGDYTFRPEDFEFTTGLMEAVKAWHDKGYLLVVITNQGGISKGRYGRREVEVLNALIKEQFEFNGSPVQAIYYCPHHDVMERCLCRKPGSLMIEKALARFDIDPSRSYMIGDSERDIIAAENAGVTGIKVEANLNWLNFDHSQIA